MHWFNSCDTGLEPERELLEPRVRGQPSVPKPIRALASAPAASIAVGDGRIGGVEPDVGSREADRADHHATMIQHRDGDRVQSRDQFAAGAGQPTIGDRPELGVQLATTGHGGVGVPRERASTQRAGALGGRHRGQHDLAAGGGVQGGGVADPVVRHQGRPAHGLIDVDRLPRAADGEVGRLVELVGQPFQHRPDALHDAQPGTDRAGQSQQTDADVVLAASTVLLHQSAALQRVEQPGGGRLVHTELGGHLADRGPTVARQQLQDLHRTIDGLDATGTGLVVVDVQRHHVGDAAPHGPHLGPPDCSARAASTDGPTRSRIQSWNAPMWCSLGTSTPPPA